MTNRGESPDGFAADPPWWPVRAANAAGGVAEAVLRRPLYRLQPADLLAEAVRHTQLTDLGEDWPDDHFTVLARSLDTEARLTPVGRRFAHRQLVGDVALRLRIIDAIRRQPEVLDRPVQRPVLMVNLPRSGSTLLQFLLARAPEMRSLWPWEVADPVAADRRSRGDVHAVQRRTRRSYRLVDRLVPAYKQIHPMASDEPEECNALLGRSFCALDLGAIYDIPSYVDHVLASDLRPAYRGLRTQIQLIQGEEAPRRWVLRTPAHLFATDALLDTFPDAVVVQLHREPLACLTSFCSLAATVRQANSDDIDPTTIGPRWMELWARGVETSLAARERAPASATFLDIDYRDFMANPLAVLDQIRRAVVPDPLPLDEQAITARIAAGRQGHPHRYRPEWFGLDRSAVADRFAGYVERFDLARV